MKVLLVNTFDTKSGSAIAARRLNRGLQRINVNAQLLVQVKRSADPTILGSVTKAEAFRGKLSRGFHNLPLKLDLKLRRQSLPAEFPGKASFAKLRNLHHRIEWPEHIV